MASVLGRDVITSFWGQISSGEYVKVFVGLSGMAMMHSLEFHEVYLQLFRLINLRSKQVHEVIHRGYFPHSVEDFIPLVQKSFDVVVFEFDSMEMANIEEVRIFLIFLKPPEENDKYLPSLHLRIVIVHPFFFHQCDSSLESVRQYLLESHRKFDVKALKTFRIVEQVEVGILVDLSDPRKRFLRAA